MKKSRRLLSIPPYIFSDLERIESERKRRGDEVISLGIGDPDLPPPEIVTETIISSLNEEDAHRYSSSAGESYFREAISDWYKNRFGVSVDPETEVCVLIGSKEGLANLARGIVDPGDRVLCPDPGYPVYSQGGALLSDALPEFYPLDEHFLPSLPFRHGCPLIYVNHPNNPTSSFATLADLRRITESARMSESVLCYDNAYSEHYFDGDAPPSVLQSSRSMDGIVEMHSLSKTFNMTGFRAGFAVGDSSVISSLKKIKSQTDSGVPRFIQRAGSAALAMYSGANRPEEVTSCVNTFRSRMHALVEGLKSVGFDAVMPKGTFYLWLKVNGSGAEFVRHMLNVGVVAVPGIAFGRAGEHYVRFSVTTGIERIRRAAELIGSMPGVESYLPG